jgi:hypothetical protein
MTVLTCRFKIGFISLAILLSIAFLGSSLGDSKDYLKGAITVDKTNGQNIEAVTFHFKDFPYDVSVSHLLSKNISEKDYLGWGRTAFQWYYNDHSEEIRLPDSYSPFVGDIHELGYSIERKDYINHLVDYCSRDDDYLNQLAKDNTTTAVTFYPKIIDGKTCTVLEYTGLMELHRDYDEPTSVVGLFVPLNETKEGCDRYLMLCSGNQTADWLDSVKVSERK